MASTRLDIRLEQEVKEKAEKAAALLGLKSLTEYVVRLMDEDASKVIAQHENLVLADNIFDRFMQACETARQPNQALRDAAAFTKEQGIR
ncbi:MAG TPA: DUF1778 domain-containing protein [Candidatus Obscuribacterales bacterium]